MPMLRGPGALGSSLHYGLNLSNPMPDFDQFQVGAVVQPLSTTSSNSLLQDADPALFYALDFWTWVVNNYPGPRLVQALAGASVKLASGGAISSAVMQAYPYEPDPQWLENQVQIPSLFAFRVRSHSEQWTLTRDHDVTELRLIYVLPPMDAAQSEKVLPILPAIAQALRKKTTDAWDPNYTPPGGNLGDVWIDPPYANLQEIGFSGAINRRVVSTPTIFYEIGRLPGAGDLWFPALILSGYLIERDEYNPTRGGVSKFAGADLTANLKADDGTVLQASASTLTKASTQQAPTVTSLSVATGSAAGGTTTVLTGANFLQGPPSVFFGPPDSPQYATSVTYVSATQLSVVTPAVSGAGSLDVTVRNRDGQSGTLRAAFAFT